MRAGSPPDSCSPRLLGDLPAGNAHLKRRWLPRECSSTGMLSAWERAYDPTRPAVQSRASPPRRRRTLSRRRRRDAPRTGWRTWLQVRIVSSGLVLAASVVFADPAGWRPGPSPRTSTGRATEVSRSGWRAPGSRSTLMPTPPKHSARSTSRPRRPPNEIPHESPPAVPSPPRHLPCPRSTPSLRPSSSVQGPRPGRPRRSSPPPLPPPPPRSHLPGRHPPRPRRHLPRRHRPRRPPRPRCLPRPFPPPSSSPSPRRRRSNNASSSSSTKRAPARGSLR